MKSFKLILLALLATAFTSESYAQMVGTDAFLMGNNIEMGIHTEGYPGSSTGSIPAPFPTHWSGGPSRLCYVANPDLSDPWLPAYDGGFYMPGSPENRFGMEVDGVTTWNSSAAGSAITSYGLSNYAINGNCRSVDWTGSNAGIDIKITYIIDVTKAYYRMLVTLENTNPLPKANVYFYYSADPDNNQFIGWGFGTTNTVESQPTPFCPKALVTATQSAAWDNYLGYGGIGDDIRVARGSFFVTDGSDVFDGTGPMIGTVGSTAFADQAIAICHRDVTLGIGAISSFEFIVIMDEAELEEALLAQYYLDYDGADPYALCTDSVVVDTLYSPCAGSTTLEMTGPNLDAYTWTWTNAITGEVVGTGPTIIVTPVGTTHYIATGVPIGACFISDIVREVVVVATGVGPSMVIDPVGPQCGSFDVTDLVITDLNAIPGTFITFYTEAPDSIDDPTDILIGDIIYPGDEIWVLMGDPAGGCYHIVMLDIEFIEITAGLDSLGHEMCNEAGGTVTLNTFIVDSSLLAGDLLEEAGPPSGGFNPVTTVFDPAGLAAGTYNFRYIALGGILCDNDTALFEVIVYNQGTAGDDNVATVCNEIGFIVDVNLLLSGHDPGGTFTEVTPTGGAFDPLTGVFTIDGGITPGDYIFEYTVLSTLPCLDDVSTFTVTVTAIPTVNAGPDQSICVGDATTVAASGTPATYIWDPAVIVDGVSFTPGVGTVTYTVTATDLFGCVNTDDLDIVVHPLPVISFVATELQGCTPFETEFTITSDVDIATTDWFFGDGDIAPGVILPNITHTYLFGGLYDVRVTVTDIYGCVSTVEYTDYITVETQPIAAFTMSPQSVFTSNTQVEFTNESLYASDFIWDFGDGSPLSNEVDPIHFFPSDVGDVFYPVELTASNYLGCVDSVTLYMNVKGIIIFYIPNTFTPDGDQFNESFVPVFESGFDPYDFHMVIYNRWGEVVFESFDATGGWNGAYGGGGLVDDGVYIWSIDFKELHSDKRHEHKGHVTILK
ncbi:MAG: gliding motility-associated-like protein [Crocinitomix sp.]|jgi:gliding motility-associated-like protein